MDQIICLTRELAVLAAEFGWRAPPSLAASTVRGPGLSHVPCTFPTANTQPWRPPSSLALAQASFSAILNPGAFWSHDSHFWRLQSAVKMARSHAPIASLPLVLPLVSLSNDPQSPTFPILVVLLPRLRPRATLLFSPVLRSVGQWLPRTVR